MVNFLTLAYRFFQMQKMMAQGGMQGGMNMQAMAKMMPQMQANMVITFSFYKNHHQHSSKK